MPQPVTNILTRILGRDVTEESAREALVKCKEVLDYAKQIQPIERDAASAGPVR